MVSLYDIIIYEISYWESDQMKLNVTLHKHTRKEYINEILKNKNVNLLFEDEIYMGNNHNHNWKCMCGNIFKRR